MAHFNPAAGQVVADDLKASFEMIDRTVLSAARLVTTFMETCAGSDLPPIASQRALASMRDSIVKQIDSRADMIAAQKAMVAIKRNSNLDVHDYGCWMFPPVSTDQQSPVSAQISA